MTKLEDEIMYAIVSDLDGDLESTTLYYHKYYADKFIQSAKYGTDYKAVKVKLVVVDE